MKMKSTKIIIKTLSELLPQLSQEYEDDKFIYDRVKGYRDLIQDHADWRDFVKETLYSLIDYYKDAYNHFLGVIDLSNNPNGIKVLKTFDELTK